MWDWLLKILKIGRKGSSAADEAAEAVQTARAAVAAQRAAELSRAQAAALEVAKAVDNAFNIAAEMGRKVGRLKAALPHPNQANVLALRSRVDFSIILDTSNELLGVAERALNTARISAERAREALSKSRVISTQNGSPGNLSATATAQKASTAADEYVSMLERSKTRLDELHRELQALRNPTGKDLPEVRRIVDAIGDEVAALESKSAEVVASAKEAEVLSRGMTLPPGVRPTDLANDDERTEGEKFQDWVDESDPMFGPIVPRKDRDAWIKPTVEAAIGAYRKFDTVMRSMSPGDDGQGNYMLKKPLEMCFPQRPQVCEDPTPVKMPEKDNSGIWNKTGDPSQPTPAAPAGSVVKP